MEAQLLALQCAQIHHSHRLPLAERRHRDQTRALPVRPLVHLGRKRLRIARKQHVRTFAQHKWIPFVVRKTRQRVRTRGRQVAPLEAIAQRHQWLVDLRIAHNVIDILARRAHDASVGQPEIVRIRHSLAVKARRALGEHTTMHRLLRQHTVGRIEFARHQIDSHRLRPVGQDAVDRLDRSQCGHRLGLAHLVGTLPVFDARPDRVAGDDDAHDAGRLPVGRVWVAEKFDVAEQPLLKEFQGEGQVCFGGLADSKYGLNYIYCDSKTQRAIGYLIQSGDEHH